jgi:hypothetical protein
MKKEIEEGITLIMEGLKKKIEEKLEDTNATVEMSDDCFVISFERKTEKDKK